MPKGIVGYLPTVNDPATEMKTVNEILSQSDEMRMMLNLQEIEVVMDQAFYVEDVQIKWEHPNIHDSIILRLRAFHISIIGRRFQDAGLKLERKMDNGVIRIHKCAHVYEAMRLAWPEFNPFVVKKYPNMQAPCSFCFRRSSG